MTVPSLAGALIAGGRSSRFGQDKALLQIQGQSLAARILGAMREAGISPLIFNGSLAPPDLHRDIRCLPDTEPGQGPLGGLLTVLEAVQGPVLVAACDMPGLDEAAFRRLVAAYVPGKGGLVAANAEGLHPLFAIYEASLIPVIRLALAGGERAMHRLVSGQGIPSLALEDPRSLRNVNTREAWSAWLEEQDQNRKP